MAERRPLVLVEGDLQELPSGDTLPGAVGLPGNDGNVGLVTTNTTNDPTPSTSSSAFASKGAVIIPNLDFNLDAVEFSVLGTPTQTVDICVARIDTPTGTIQEILHDIGTLAIVNPSDRTRFTFPTPIKLTKDLVYAIFFVRTDGGPTDPLSITFDTGNASNNDPNGFWRLASADGIRYASNAPAVSDSPVDTSLNAHAGVWILGSITAQLIPAGGTTGQSLVKTSNTDYDTEWITGVTGLPVFSGARIVPASNQSISASTLTTLALDTEVIDQGGWFDPATPNKLIVPPGVSYATFHAGFQVDVAGSSKELEMFIQLNGNAICYQRTSPSGWGGMSLTTGLIAVSPGDEIQASVWSNDPLTLRSSRCFLTALADSGTGQTAIIVTEETASFNVTDDMLDGKSYKEVNSASAVTVTVPSGLTKTGALVIEATGTGTVSIAAGAGVTINSFNSLLDIGGQHGVVTLMPKGTDTYTLFGNLA